LYSKKKYTYYYIRYNSITFKLAETKKKYIMRKDGE